MRDQRGFDTEPVAWHWHLYRPEALMIYILIGLGIFFYFYEQDDLRLTRIVPLDDGSALAMGFDAGDDGEGNLKIWRTGLDEKAEWVTDLEANFVPAHQPNADWPICTTIDNRAYLLQGQQSEGGGKMLGLACINLEDGTLEWENWEHPTGDAEFGSVFAWQDQLVTTHRAIRDGKEKIFIVGREIVGGAMTWTKVYNLTRPWQSRFSFLPGMVLVEENNLSLLETKEGKEIKNWQGKHPYYSGGWIFYQFAEQLMAFNLLQNIDVDSKPTVPEDSSMDADLGLGMPVDSSSNGFTVVVEEGDTIIHAYALPFNVDYSTDSIIFFCNSPESQPGFYGFYRGFPVHLSQEGIYLKFQDSILYNPMAFEWSSSPNGQLPPNLTTRPGFLNEDLTRFIPVMGSFAESDSLRATFPKVTENRSLSGDRFIWLDMENLGPSSISKALPKGWAKGQFTSWQGYHYYLGSAVDQPEQPLVLKFDGMTGQLAKAVTTSYKLKGLHTAYPRQPIGNRLWFAGSSEWGALRIPDMELTFTTNDSIRFTDVTDTYKGILGN